MNTIAEIESAIQKLPESQVIELVIWLDQFCQQNLPQPALEAWLNRARGAARPGVTTQEIMALMRDEISHIV